MPGIGRELGWPGSAGLDRLRPVGGLLVDSPAVRGIRGEVCPPVSFRYFQEHIAGSRPPGLRPGRGSPDPEPFTASSPRGHHREDRCRGDPDALGARSPSPRTWPTPTTCSVGPRRRPRAWRSCRRCSTPATACCPITAPSAEGLDGPTLRHLSMRAREWGMAIAGGFVEREGRHLYDSLAFASRTAGSRLSEAEPGLLGAVPVQAGPRPAGRRRRPGGGSASPSSRT